MKKLPTVDAAFWVLMVSATTMGETAGDLTSTTLHLGYGMGSVVLIGVLILALAVQLVSKVQHPILYWTVIVLTSTAGTDMSDYVNRTLGFGYLHGTLAILCVLLVVFGIWKWSAASLSTERVQGPHVESLYWAAILVSSTLGTALGDLLAHDTPLGFGGGTVVLAATLAVVTLAALFTKVPRTLCFWLGIIVIHPVGATMGDYMTKPEGLDLGNVEASVALLAVFAVIAAVLRTRRPEPSPA